MCATPRAPFAGQPYRKGIRMPAGATPVKRGPGRPPKSNVAAYEYVCPECHAKGDRFTTDSVASIVAHRRRKHNVKGKNTVVPTDRSGELTKSKHKGATNHHATASNTNGRGTGAAAAQTHISFEEAEARGHFGYALGHVESWLEIYAASIGVPASQLTVTVAELLLTKTRGKVLGGKHSVLTMRV
jgi:hypothetical protein